MNIDTFQKLGVTRPDSTVFVGVDLGKKENYSAIVVLERFEVTPDYTGMLRGEGFRTRYVVRQAERLALGTPYTEVVGRVKRVVTGLQGTMGKVVLVVDETGPGGPVVEMMRAAGMGCAVRGMTITAGEKATATGSGVPRAVLVTRLQVMLELGELEIAAGCRDGEALERELGYLQLSGKAAGEQDDLGMSLAMVCWLARRG